MSVDSTEVRAECITRLCEVLKHRSTKMKARDVSFAIRAITHFNKEGFLTQEHADELYKGLEKVVLAKLEDFIPHLLVDVFCSFSQAG